MSCVKVDQKMESKKEIVRHHPQRLRSKLRFTQVCCISNGNKAKHAEFAHLRRSMRPICVERESTVHFSGSEL